MDVSEVLDRVKSAMPEADVKVEGKDCDFTLTVISDEFQSLTRIKRQQQVLGYFSQELATGEIHALSIKTFTGNEWQVSQQNELTQLVSL